MNEMATEGALQKGYSTTKKDHTLWVRTLHLYIGFELAKSLKPLKVE